MLTSTFGAANASITTAPIALPTTAVLFSASWKEDRKENEVELEYDFTKAFGARIGYRYTRRFVFASGENAQVDPENVTLEPGDFEGEFDNAKQPIHAGLFGFWIRPNEQFRASFDMEINSASVRVGGGELGSSEVGLGVGTLTRITPDHEQQYRLRVNYNPRRWITFAGSGNVREATNNVVATEYRFHNRNYGINTTFLPNDRFTFDLGYNYQGYLQQDFICPINTASGTPPLSIATPFISGTTVFNRRCPFDVNQTPGASFGQPTGLFQTLGRYENVNHFFNALIRGRVVPRVTLGLGYSIVNSDGAQVLLNPLLVPGSLKSNFHRPLADVEVELAKDFFAKAGWNYYGYNEKLFGADAAAGLPCERDHFVAEIRLLIIGPT